MLRGAPGSMLRAGQRKEELLSTTNEGPIAMELMLCSKEGQTELKVGTNAMETLNQGV